MRARGEGDDVCSTRSVDDGTSGAEMSIVESPFQSTLHVFFLFEK